MTEPALKPIQITGIAPEQFPRHIAIIMDGNGRWAAEHGQPRLEGHRQGAETVRKVVTHCARLGIEVLTLYSFSTENWNRSKEEVGFLMELYARYLVAERDTIMDNNVRFLHFGRREGLPEAVLSEMDKTVEMSRLNTGLKLCLALNYGARDEIIGAVRSIAEQVAGGEIKPRDIEEATISNLLYSAGLPDPDLLIRTAGERRVSNFLLWQISYTEMYFCDALWPEFGKEQLEEAIRDFVGRSRKFGGVNNET